MFAASKFMARARLFMAAPALFCIRLRKGGTTARGDLQS
jgi:hypothetical protein